MKKIIVTFLICLSTITLNLNSILAIETTNNDAIEFYEEFYNTAETDRKVYKDGQIVTDEFINLTNDFYENNDFESIALICANGYELEYTSKKARSYEVVSKKYTFENKSSEPQDSSLNTTCHYIVSFVCKYTVNVNTGNISTVADPVLTLEYGVVTNFPGNVYLTNQSSYTNKIGTNYVSFGYKFRVTASINTGLKTVIVHFDYPQGIKTLYAS